MDKHLPLHSLKVQKLPLIINRLHILLHFTALSALVYYRVSFLSQIIKEKHTPILPTVLVIASELILSCLWLLNQAYRWRPVSRKAFPERLPENTKLPAIDVFICTADPVKEPTLGVMNTVISAMALDYPADKLSVYLHDDGGSSVTLKAMTEAWRFAKWWLPFCRRFGVKTLCPQAYFSGGECDYDCGEFRNTEFEAHRNKVQEKYEVFRDNIKTIAEDETPTRNDNHSSAVEVIHDHKCQELSTNEIPLLVYVSREKRPNHPHRFKAGALNALLRVSNMMSNSEYILGLDCDMYCNDPNSARQAMCFFLDPKLSPSLSHVQFPQRFHNLSKSDIYGSQLRSLFTVAWQGMDGLEGPMISGTCYYIKRDALFYGTSNTQDLEVGDMKHIYGASNELIESLLPNYNPNPTNDEGDITATLHQEIKLVISCTYEMGTNWGKEVGFRYSVVEDYLTSLILHSKGWISVFYNPTRPAFLGTCTTSLNDVLVQGTRWSAGLVKQAISKPLIYAPLKMSILESMCYIEIAYLPFFWFPVWCLATIPQLCLLNDIHLYPEVRKTSIYIYCMDTHTHLYMDIYIDAGPTPTLQVSSSYFVIFSFIFISSQLKHMQEVYFTGGTFQHWINEQRMWIVKAITSQFYGSLTAIMEKIGIREANFLPTNKVEDDELAKRYQMGIFDFQTSTMFLAPLCTLVILNMVSLFGGVVKAILVRTYGNVIQIFISLYVVVLGYPIIEGMIMRTDKGRVLPYVIRLSIVLALIFLIIGKLVLM